MSGFLRIPPYARTSTISYSPRDLASTVHSELLNRNAGPPALDVLIELFESMYFTSLKTEESKPVLFHLVYLDPQKPDPKPPDVTVHDRWSCARIAPPVTLNSASFVKIARRLTLVRLHLLFTLIARDA